MFIFKLYLKKNKQKNKNPAFFMGNKYEKQSYMSSFSSS